jgi:hypothetical protein
MKSYAPPDEKACSNLGREKGRRIEGEKKSSIHLFGSRGICFSFR